MSQSQFNSREWDAAEYHRWSVPQYQWGQRVISELRLDGDEYVLDAGCGTGKLTALLLQNLPRGRVVGLDLSRNMLRHAQLELRPKFGERIQFVAADLIAFASEPAGVVASGNRGSPHARRAKAARLAYSSLA